MMMMMMLLMMMMTTRGVRMSQGVYEAQPVAGCREAMRDGRLFVLFFSFLVLLFFMSCCIIDTQANDAALFPCLVVLSYFLLFSLLSNRPLRAPSSMFVV